MNLHSQLHTIFDTITQPDPKALKQALERLQVTLDDLRPYLEAPGNHPYGRKLLYQSKAVEVLVMNWAYETECEPHTHGDSMGWVVILTGEATHTIYTTDGKKIPIPDQCHIETTHTMMFCPVGLLHKMGNPHKAPLVTLHIYSPPITGMKVYDLERDVEYVVTDDCGAWVPENEVNIVRSVSLEGDR